MLNDTVIEVAFTVGSSANSNFLGGSNLDASIAQQVTAANTAFQDVGLDIEIRNVGTYILGDDSNLTGSAALEAAAFQVRDHPIASTVVIVTRQDKEEGEEAHARIFSIFAMSCSGVRGPRGNGER